MTNEREAGALPPEHGARFVLELETGAVGHARYRLLVEGAAPARTVATLEASKVELGAWDGAVEPWALEMALGFLRTLAKNHAAAGDWPRVLRRWRTAERV